ncbi:UNVERIFIED_CONTAM: hypothetical protein O8I53_06220 [Campylobacter lari]
MEEELDKLNNQKTSYETTLNELNKLPKVLEELKSYTEEFKKFDPSTFTSETDLRAFFNSTVDRYKAIVKVFDNKLEKASEFVASFVDYISLDSIAFDLDKRLLNIYKEGIKEADNLIIELRKKQINNDIKVKNLINTKGFQLQNEDDIYSSKSRIELIDKLVKKGILQANASAEEINSKILKVNLTDVKKEDQELILTFRERSTNSAAYSPDNVTPNLNGYTNRFIKLRVNANIEDKRVTTINDLFSNLGYKKLVTPTLIRESGNIINSTTGIAEKGFDIFADSYQDLTSTLLQEVPYAGE